MTDTAAEYTSTSIAAAEAGVSRVTLWRWCQAHPGLAIRVGGRTRPDLRKIRLIASGVPLAEAASHEAA